jgi:hypothetical protein
MLDGSDPVKRMLFKNTEMKSVTVQETVVVLADNVARGTGVRY